MAFSRFELCRHDDVSGISGTGRVAEGAQFSTGQCVIAWISATPSITIFDNVDELLAIHGHDGKTELVWLDVDDEPDSSVSVGSCPARQSSGPSSRRND